MKKSKIYTGTGDKGYTSLITGHRVRKNNVRIDAYGTVDELNSFLGFMISEMEEEPVLAAETGFLRGVQHNLFVLGSYLANDTISSSVAAEEYNFSEAISRIEFRIDFIDSELPKLRNFILPGGCKSASLAHVCRTICRRAERSIYAIEDTENTELSDTVKQYFNRLSDYLFVLSRFLNHFHQKEEIYWDKNWK